MKILKFGGTSVGSPQRMKDVCKLITDGQKKIVVLSAMSGTTNTLVEIADYFQKKNAEAANNVINKLRRTYMKHVEELYETEEMAEKTKQLLISPFIPNGRFQRNNIEGHPGPRGNHEHQHGDKLPYGAGCQSTPHPGV